MKTSMKNILVVAPHPDDETLGCGGTLLRHKEDGDALRWLIMTNISENSGFTGKVVSERQKEIEKVGRSYGFRGVFKLDFPAAGLDKISMAEQVRKISEIIKRTKPDIIYMPHKGDVHSDHRITFDALISATKSFRAPYVKKIISYEVISDTEFAPGLKEDAFIPNYFVDISGFLDKKLKIIEIYKSELGNHPFPRNLKNIKALATYRGATAGCKYAEGFMLLKEIRR